MTLDKLTIEFDREEDGRWIAEVLEIGGCLVYGTTQYEAALRVVALAFEVIAEHAMEHS